MKIIVFLLVLLICLSLTFRASAKDIEVEVYADENYPPYSYVEDGIVKGIYSEILKTAFSKMEGYQVTITPAPWKRGLSYLEHGSGFAIYPPYQHKETRLYISPYSVPILEEKVVVFCRDEILNKPRPRWPEDYYGLKIGNNSGFKLGGDAFWQAVEKGLLEIQEVKSATQNIMMLALRRTDCYINDRLSILWEINHLKAIGKYNSKHATLEEGATISSEHGFLGYTNQDKGKFSFKEDFVQKLDATINAMKQSGELDKIVNSFIQ